VLRVLLIQTDSRAAQDLTKYFQSRNDDLLLASDLEQAESLTNLTNPDLIVLDMHLISSDWLSYLTTVKEDNPLVKIIITSRFPDLQREMLMKDFGVRVFVRKPFSKPWMDAAMRKIISPASEELVSTELRQIKTLSRQIDQPTPRVRMSVRIKIILPYLILVLLFAFASAYIVSNIMISSVQDRFYNQILETGLQSADWMVREENRMLSTIRFITNTQDVAENVISTDVDALNQILLPIVVNEAEESVDILDASGISLLSMRLNEQQSSSDYEISRGEQFFQSVNFIQETLKGTVDEQGDKFAGVIQAPWGNYFSISGPIYDQDGDIVGAVIVSRSLDSIVRQMKRETLAETTLYNLNGEALASTFYIDRKGESLSQEQLAEIRTLQTQNSLTRELQVSNIDYVELIGPWLVRGGTEQGYFGVSLAQAFLINTSLVSRRQIFFLVVSGILLVVVIGYSLSNRITKPLNRLVAASTEVAQGNLSVTVPVIGDDEVAVLSHSFNFMVTGLQEGSIYRDLLGRTVSPEVREQLRRSFDTGDLRLAGQEALATVLMTDIRDFTRLSENTDPARVFEWLNDYYGQLVPIITAYGGVVNKFDGDALLAFFGILPKPLAPKDSANAACQAAVEMIAVLEKFNANRVNRGERKIHSGIGINTGPVMAGGLGASDRLHYTIIGDTVNTAQRLESLSREFYSESGIIVGYSSYAALEERSKDFNFEAAGEHVVKGKAERVQVYKLLPIILKR
jgi:adenylate cyclase